MKKIAEVFDYHERTKHHPHRYAASLGYLDWATQPNPFREYLGSKKIELQQSFHNTTPPYNLLGSSELPSAPLCFESISQLFQFAFGVTAYKSYDGVQEFALRANASSGNLQPIEAYLIAPSIEGISIKNSISHYNVQKHQLELLQEDEGNLQNSSYFYVALSAVIWREAWKYGERAFRYTQMDTGHAAKAVEVSAQMLGWECEVIHDYKDLNTLLGFDQSERYINEEFEEAQLLIRIQCKEEQSHLLPSNFSTSFEGRANQLSPSHHEWDILPKITSATREYTTTLPSKVPTYREKKSTKESKDVVLKRRSAQAMDKYNSQISYEVFITLLQSTNNPVLNLKVFTNLIIFVHNVKGLESGLYAYLRDESYLQKLQNELSENFLWKNIDENLYLLKEDDYRVIAKTLSCTQDIAKDSAFSLSFLGEFREPIEKYGAKMYRTLYQEAGALGQQLYLEATSLSLSATGIGCYLDDVMHRILALKNNNFQTLYHFTIGRAIVDSRVLTKLPY